MWVPTINYYVVIIQLQLMIYQPNSAVVLHVPLSCSILSSTNLHRILTSG